jgi:hypothetical protein
VSDAGPRPALGLAAGFVSAPLVYACVRVAQHRMSPEPDPAAVIWAEHSAALSRFTVTGFVSAMVLIAWLALARRGGPDVVRALAWLAAGSSVAVLVQSGLRP